MVEFASLLGNEDHYPLSAESQLWLVCETSDPSTPPAWEAIGRIEWAYSSMGRVCNDLAIEAELKQRLINGRPVKAEDYIGQWRLAMKSPRTLSDLTVYGIALLGKVEKPVKGVLEEAKRNPENRIEELMESPFVTERTDGKVIWNVPLTDLANLKVYMRLGSIWLHPDTYPDQVDDKVVVTRSASGATASPGRTQDLFSVLEMAA